MICIHYGTGLRICIAVTPLIVSNITNATNNTKTTAPDAYASVEVLSNVAWTNESSAHWPHFFLFYNVKKAPDSIRDQTSQFRWEKIAYLPPSTISLTGMLVLRLVWRYESFEHVLSQKPLHWVVVSWDRRVGPMGRWARAWPWLPRKRVVLSHDCTPHPGRSKTCRLGHEHSASIQRREGSWEKYAYPAMQGQWALITVLSFSTRVQGWCSFFTVWLASTTSTTVLLPKAALKQHGCLTLPLMKLLCTSDSLKLLNSSFE